MQAICPVLDGSIAVLPEMRMARVEKAIGRHKSGALSCVEAASVGERRFGRRKAQANFPQLRIAP